MASNRVNTGIRLSQPLKSPMIVRGWVWRGCVCPVAFAFPSPGVQQQKSRMRYGEHGLPLLRSPFPALKTGIKNRGWVWRGELEDPAFTFPNPVGSVLWVKKVGFMADKKSFAVLDVSIFLWYNKGTKVVRERLWVDFRINSKKGERNVLFVVLLLFVEKEIKKQ